jgi:hypothetical protein
MVENTGKRGSELQQVVVFTKDAKYVAEYDKGTEVELLDGQVTKDYVSPKGLGYRGDTILNHMKEYQLYEFTSVYANMLLINAAWSKATFGKEDGVKYVEILNIKVYQNGVILHKRSHEPYFKIGTGTVQEPIRYAVQSVKFKLNGYTLLDVLFTNNGIYDFAKRGFDNDSKKYKPLIQTLLSKNLLLEGELNYYTLVYNAIDIKSNL